MYFKDKFTEEAAKAIRYARQSAGNLGHNYVGSEHLLNGILKENSSLATRVLISFDITEHNVTEKIRNMMGMGAQSSDMHLQLTPRVKNIIEIAASICIKYGGKSVSPEHLLLAIIEERQNVAVKIITSLGTSPDVIYNTLKISMGADKEKDTIEISKCSENVRMKYEKMPELKMLTQFSKNLTLEAATSKLDPVIGRDDEVNRMAEILSRRSKNNAVLIGEPGVGKTAIVEGLAQRIASGEVSDNLKNKQIMSLDLSAMVAGTKYRGEFEERVKNVLSELSRVPDIILFIDEMHMIIGAGMAEGAIDAANILKPALSRGEIQVIGATTNSEYRKFIEKDVALERRFQKISVPEPTIPQAIDILHGLKSHYESHHNVIISDEAIVSAVELSSRFIAERFLPDKAIDLIDEGCASLKLAKKESISPEVLKLQDSLNRIVTEKNTALFKYSFTKANLLEKKESELKADIEKSKHLEKPILRATHIAEIVTKSTGIKVSSISYDEAQNLLALEELLHERVIGQHEAIKVLSKAIRRSRAGFSNEKKPIGSFLFLGPTGVGKTELSKALSEILFSDERALIKIDMSEYMEKQSISRLIGSPPGYIGYEEGGQLTEKVRKKPYSVILFDEVEKAHPDIFNIFLQILEDGELTDGQGRNVCFKNTIIIMTSNIGAKKIVSNRKSLGFSAQNSVLQFEEIKENVLAELKSYLRPELFNRFDEIIVFEKLSKYEICKITQNLIEDLKKRAQKLGTTLIVDDDVAEFIANSGFDELYGARPLKREIRRKMEDLLADAFITGEIGDFVKISLKDSQLVLLNHL